MFGFGDKFYDEMGNFNNKKFLKFLEKARKANLKKNLGAKKYSLNIDINLFKSVSRKELWSFINKLAIFMSSGIDIKGALFIIEKQIKNPYLKEICITMKENIDHGISISETMEQYSRVFDPLTIALIGVGEKTGKLSNILTDLDTNILESIELKGKVKGAIMYPLILLFLTVSMVSFMMIFVVPRITESFTKSGVDLPFLTQKVVDVSTFLKNDYLNLITIIIIIFLAFKAINMTYKGKIFFANVYIRLPIFGYIVKQSNIVYFVKSFSTLLDSGVLLLDSIKTASRVVPNIVYKKEIIRVKNEVEVGLTISKSLGLNLDYGESIYTNKLFPEDFAYVINTGEETGTISKSIKRVGDNYNRELKRYIGNLSTLLEPIIIVVIGILIGIIVVAIMLPFFELGKVAKKL